MPSRSSWMRWRIKTYRRHLGPYPSLPSIDIEDWRVSFFFPPLFQQSSLQWNRTFFQHTQRNLMQQKEHIRTCEVGVGSVMICWSDRSRFFPKCIHISFSLPKGLKKHPQNWICDSKIFAVHSEPLRIWPVPSCRAQYTSKTPPMNELFGPPWPRPRLRLPVPGAKRNSCASLSAMQQQRQHVKVKPRRCWWQWKNFAKAGSSLAETERRTAKGSLRGKPTQSDTFQQFFLGGKNQSTIPLQTADPPEGYGWSWRVAWRHNSWRHCSNIFVPVVSWR